MSRLASSLGLFGLLVFFGSCLNDRVPSKTEIAEINLKRGAVATCGPPEQEFGSVNFTNSCGPEVQEDFNLAMALLHSFEYDEAEKTFSRIIDRAPGCAMAYWGVAMSNFHPLWAPPSEPELEKGLKAITLAQQIPNKTKREKDYLEAIASFYRDWKTVDHKQRCKRFESAMERLYATYPDDKEAAIFFALALNAAADPADKSYKKQLRAGEILKRLYRNQPDHPGLVHYTIHSYDYPELAEHALPAARKYASVAPSSAHALHMPSHIFTRLGLWEENIHSNMASVEAAQCYAESNGIKGHWDEELHGLDYLVYGYLQLGDNKNAKAQVDYVQQMKKVEPINFKVAYALAAIPARYLLENKLWKEAAQLESRYPNFPWKEHPWQQAIIHFTRAMGSLNTGDLAATRKELMKLDQLHKVLTGLKDEYKANQVKIQQTSVQAWLKLKENKRAEAIRLMQIAADMEDKTEKHPVTPAEVLPARELLAELYLQINQPHEALEAFTANLRKHPNRFNSLFGAGISADRAKKHAQADSSFRKLLATASPESGRTEIRIARQYLRKEAGQQYAAQVRKQAR